MELVLIIWAAFGVAAAVVASNRGGNGCLWFGLGVLLGPLGFALAFTEGSKCPTCSRKISAKALVCPYCHHDFRRPVITNAGPQRRCPFCAEVIQPAAIKCRYCGESLPPPLPLPVPVIVAAPIVVPAAKTPAAAIDQAEEAGPWWKGRMVLALLSLVVAAAICITAWNATAHQPDQRPEAFREARSELLRSHPEASIEGIAYSPSSVTQHGNYFSVMLLDGHQKTYLCTGSVANMACSFLVD